MELEKSENERTGPPPRKKRREEGTRLVEGFEVGSGCSIEVDDGPGHYYHREPALVQADISDLTAVEESLKAVLDNLGR
jgi:hypothetical protein